MSVIVITGASSGLGREYFKAASERYGDCEFWLVSRRKEALLETAALNKNVKCRIIPCDLSDEKELFDFTEMMKNEDPDIRLFVKNARYGKLGYTDSIPPKVQSNMVILNCASLTALCAEAVHHIKAGGSIINIASIASFAPTPRMAVYSSTKAYVRAFSNCLREELKPKKINVLAVCPGPMKTGFLSAADITDENSKAFRDLPYCDASEIARKSIIKAEKGRAVYTNRFIYKFYRLIAKLLPHSLVMKFSKC